MTKRESLEEFLARGGSINQLPASPVTDEQLRRPGSLGAVGGHRQTGEKANSNKSAQSIKVSFSHGRFNF